MNIFLPTEVKNAIEDVFLENDTIDDVECYFADEKSTFEADITLLNNINIDINGHSAGTTNAVWTYYGDIDYSLSESTVIMDGETQVHEITENIRENTSEIMRSGEFQVVLIEVTEWDTTKEEEKLTQKTVLKIFCPYTEDGIKVGG